MAGTADQDEPLDWTIDRVIAEICHKQIPAWMIDAKLKPFNDPVAIETAFRNNDIDGDALLNLEEDNIRADLDIASFGQRRRLKQIISVLRQRSEKYESSSLLLELDPQLSHRTQQSRASSSSYGMFYAGENRSPDTEMFVRPSKTPLPQARSQGNNCTPYAESQVTLHKSPKIQGNQEGELLNGLENHLDEDLWNKQSMNSLVPGQHIAPNKIYIQSGEVKRRRVAPDHLSDKPLSAIATETKTKPKTVATSDLPPANKSLVSAHQTIISDDRLTSSASAEDYAQERYVQRTSHTISPSMILLNEKLSAVRQNLLDAEVALDADFGWEAPNANTKMQRIAAKHIKGYMAGDPRTIVGAKTWVIERKQKVKRLDGKQILTVNPMGPPTESAVKDGLNMNMSLRLITDLNTTNQSHGNPSASIVDMEDGYQRLLEDYPADDSDNVLPVYGESDEEDRYVTDGSISDIDEKSDVPSTNQSAQLSKVEIDSVIDEAILEFKADHLLRKLPKIQRIAHEKWMLAFKLPGTRVKMLKAARTDLESALRRLPTFRSALHDSTWTKASDVKQLCDALSATVDLIEESNYFIRVLESEQEPSRPTHEATKQPRVRRKLIPGGEDNCSSEDDDFDDFITNNEIDGHLEGAGSVDVNWNPQLATPEHRLSDKEDSENSSMQAKVVQRGNPVAEVSTTQTEDNVSITDLEDDEVVAQDEIGVVANYTRQGMMEDVQYGPPRTPIRTRAFNEAFVDADDESDQIVSTKRTKSATKRALNDSKKRNPMTLPHYTDSSDDMSDTGSDFDRSFCVPGIKYKKQGRPSIQPIDLTMSSPLAPSSIDADFEIRTPELNPVDTQYGRVGADEPDLISLASPELPDIEMTLRTKWRAIKKEEKENSTLALAKSVYLLVKGDARMLLSYVIGLGGPTGLKELLQIYLSAIDDDDSEPIRTHILKKHHDAAAITTCLFVSYHCACEVTKTSDVTLEESDAAWNATKKQTAHFRTLLIDLLEFSLQYSPPSTSLQDKQPENSEATDQETSIETGLDTTTDLDTEGQHLVVKGRRRGSPKGSRNKTHAENPMDVQRSGKKRMAEQSRLKAALTHKLRGLMSSTGSALVPINFKEPIVYLDDSIAPRLRAHQVNGIQFIWRELVEDPKHQGGLLAHTMGLGKTMQVITVLATIAQCNSSTNPEIKAHIPKHLRDLRVLVLCPPTLIANWYEELILWLPRHDTLGPIYRIGNTNNKPYWDIKRWAGTGGVLLLAYGRLVSFCKTVHRGSGATDDQHKEMADWLLELPKVVVADEAHMLKNPLSQTSVYANKILTHSRIALTGSPLSNHLEEYWAMIDFVAPKYLGEKSNFQNKFVKPIELSLREESNAYERRIGLKKLHVLKRILAPKVHRADITALHIDLPPKTEFYITVPLTSLQKEAYTLYVRHFRSAAAQETSLKVNILTWIAMLSLLINHPFCFVEKLEREGVENEMLDKMIRGHECQADRTSHPGKNDDDDAGLAEDVDISEDSAILSVADKAIQLFHGHKVAHSLDDPGLSYRCLVVKHILEGVLEQGEKTLIFSHSIPTLNYLALMLEKMNCKYDRIDGRTNTRSRQSLALDFNTGASGAMVFLISTRAGGLGLNLQGATRVIVFDYGWNPSWEEQAIGRAFRMGQKNPVFVYRFRAGGTYEDITFNSAVFKTQLFSRVVDHKSLLRKGTKTANAQKYLFDPKDPDQKDLSDCIGKDIVLDRVLTEVDCVRSIELTETFTQDIEEDLTPEEEREANQELESEKLQLTNPAEYNRLQQHVAQNAVHASFAAQTQPTQRQNRMTPGFGVIDNALRQQPLTSLSKAAQQSTIPELPSNALPNVEGINGKRISYEDPFYSSRAPAWRRPSSHDRLRTDGHQEAANASGGHVQTAAEDDNLQKLRDHNAPGCQTQ